MERYREPEIDDPRYQETEGPALASKIVCFDCLGEGCETCGGTGAVEAVLGEDS